MSLDRVTKAGIAGTLTHEESSLLSEIAQHVALSHGADVWVDGSLWNHEWHAERFARVRQDFPHYRIAIIAVTARPEIVQERLLTRGEQTGRYVPPGVARTAAKAIEMSVPRLSPLVDFFMRIRNDGDNSSGNLDSPDPILERVEVQDESGDWDLVKRLTRPD